MNTEVKENKLNEILFQYWEDLKGDKEMPCESDIKSEEIADVWDNCFLVEKNGDKYAYSHLGKSIIEAYGDAVEGEDIIEDDIYPESPSILAKLEEVSQTKEPMHYEGAFINRNNMDIKFRKMLLPLGDNGEVKYILGGMRWRFF